MDFRLSRQKKGRSLGQRDSISACGSEREVQNGEEKETQRSVGRSAWLRAVVETMRTILLRTSRCSQRVHTPMLRWMSVTVATRPPMPPTGQTCIKLNFYFFEMHAVTQLSITRVKNLCHQEFETAGGKKRHFGVCVLITNTAGHKADAHVLMKIIHRSSHLSGCGP